MIQPHDANAAPTESGPAWEIARLFPDQGFWSEEDFFWLDNVTGGRVELCDGRVEILPMPTEGHQFIIIFLMDVLRAFIKPRDLGVVLFSGIRVRLEPGKIREPDVVFMKKENAARRSDKYWTGADLAIEVVSTDDPDRDYVKKRQEYALAGIPEYWIVDPRTERITVLTLPPGKQQYDLAGEYRRGDAAASVLLPGFSVDVTAAFESANV